MTRTFSISEAASQTGLTIDTLRYYERAGLMLDDVERAASGHRRYSERDVRWVVLLTKFRRTGMPIRTMRDYANLVRAGDGDERERLALLEAHRAAVLARMEETRRNLQAIDHKIAHYRSYVDGADLERSPDDEIRSGDDDDDGGKLSDRDQDHVASAAG